MQTGGLYTAVLSHSPQNLPLRAHLFASPPSRGIIVACQKLVNEVVVKMKEVLISPDRQYQLRRGQRMTFEFF